MPGSPLAWKSGLEPCSTDLPSRSEALRFVQSAKAPSTKVDGSLVNFRHGLPNLHERPKRVLTSTCEGIYAVWFEPGLFQGIFHSDGIKGICLKKKSLSEINSFVEACSQHLYCIDKAKKNAETVAMWSVTWSFVSVLRWLDGFSFFTCRQKENTQASLRLV